MQRTTLALDERLLAQIKAKARREGRKLQDCTNEILRLGLEAEALPRRRSKSLPTFDLGKTTVDISDREALYDLMDEVE